MKKPEPALPPAEVAEPADTVMESPVPANSETGQFSAEQIEELKARADKGDEHWERLLRTTADFENFKKRAARERQDAVKFANESLIQKIIPVLDNFEMALAAARSSAATDLKSLSEGVTMIHSQLRQLLAEVGLEDIIATDQAFDPNLHEAVSQQETETVSEGQVLQQLRKGYKLRERLLRPATVIVARKPTASTK